MQMRDPLWLNKGKASLLGRHTTLTMETGYNMLEDEDDFSSEYETCVGRLCFTQPYSRYVPPRYYRRIPGREYRYKVGAKLTTAEGLRFKFQRALALPNCLGLGDDGRWRWQWIPLALSLGLTVDAAQHRVPVMKKDGHKHYAYTTSLRPSPFARFRALSPVFGKLALRPMLEVLPAPSLTVKRAFRVGHMKLVVGANLEVGSLAKGISGPRWSLLLNWHPADSVKVAMQPINDVIAVQYSRGLNLTPECRAVAAGLVEVPSQVMLDGVSRNIGNLPVKVKVDYMKVSHTIGAMAKRDEPYAVSKYLRASQNIGRQDIISVLPGHWIDPGFEPGAPGERDFNLEVANVVEKQLRCNGWEVLRPDRDAPHLAWEEYLNWVSSQTLKGHPVMEIHGQGTLADCRGHVLGVIGDCNAPLNKELAGDFGFFQMDWRDLAVPRRGGVIVESFNSDEVLQMAPWHRTWAVRRLANRMVRCIERASSSNRSARGVFVDFDSEDDLLPAGK